MQIEELHESEWYALFAPDGSFQALSLSNDFPTCVAQIKLLHKKGLGLSFHELTMRGFKILPVKITMVQNGDENKPFAKQNNIN